MTPTPNNTHASQLTTNEPTIRSNNSALLASNPSVVALALSTYTKPPFTAAVHKTRRQHTNCAYGNKNKLTGGVVTPRHVVPAPCGRLRRKREVIVRLETLYIQLEVLHETHRGRLQLAVPAVIVLDGRHQRFHCKKTKHAVIRIAHTKVKINSPARRRIAIFWLFLTQSSFASSPVTSRQSPSTSISPAGGADTTSTYTFGLPTGASKSDTITPRLSLFRSTFHPLGY